MTKETDGFSTRAIHHGYDAKDHQGSLNPPVYMTSTFTFETAESGGAMFAGEQAGHFYSRISNPTLDQLEQRIANLEGAEAGLATASGMGAISSVFWTFVKAGDEVIIDKTLYGCTFAFLSHGLTKFDVTVKPVDMTDPKNVQEAITDRTKVVYFETPANPNNRLVDITAISEIAHKVGARVVVDNTYATPVLTRPIEHGADIVLHSATKYLGGHGDLIAGLVVGSAEDMMQVRLIGVKDMTGAVMAPLTAMLILRGLKTLELRVERHCQSARKIAEALQAHPAVLNVAYPGLDSFPQAELAQRQMANFGGMVPFEVKGGKAGGIAMMNRLKLIQRAVSLGDAESLIQHPASMTHSTYTPEERAEHGIAEGLVRLSVGLETADDIIDDLMKALSQHNAIAA
ncbi:methionine gamma-lyase [Cognatishimia sp. 1_MG-2023]|uniref:methionine gamma-lyase n=1 Tax=Cognatishimia sp. 1_MG-2023 TaxID=3062642 RepID=UPI0026E19252|nr:methionine gamma-lyase [Cognatishimia sp. 1_MG-2023]MDO6728260.1 methionine gamma-lyase [Cognatishimia sp. 1_MG-2023]